MSARYTGDAERVRAALAVIPAHDYITWVDMAFAVKHGLGEAGFEIWDEWSRGASNYSERAARTIWRSARAAGGTTLGTLFWLAQQHGFNLTGPGMSAVDAAAGVRERLAGQDTIREEWREQEKARTRRAAVAREAASIWQWARPVGPQHPYLVRKQVEPVPTLRELEATELHTLLGYMPSRRGEGRRLLGRRAAAEGLHAEPPCPDCGGRGNGIVGAACNRLDRGGCAVVRQPAQGRAGVAHTLSARRAACACRARAGAAVRLARRRAGARAPCRAGIRCRCPDRGRGADRL